MTSERFKEGIVRSRRHVYTITHAPTCINCVQSDFFFFWGGGVLFEMTVSLPLLKDSFPGSESAEVQVLSLGNMS